MMKTVTSVLVVGAGMSGLTAARRLTDAGFQVRVLDKGRGPGGRMATRRMTTTAGDTLRVDHGAQFFTARSKAFREAVAQWERQQLAATWCHGFPKTPVDAARDDGHPRFMSPSGMTTIPKHVAHSLDVVQQMEVVEMRQENRRWTVTTSNGKTYSSDALILTAPIPQSLALLASSNLTLPPEEQDALSRITYDCCLAVMALLDGPSRVPEPGAIQFHCEPLDWIADATQKGTAVGGHAVTLHGAPAFSRKHFDGDRIAAAQELIAHSASLLQSRVVDFQVHGWRYAAPRSQYPGKCLTICDPAPLVLAGDSFGECRVEGAFLSGEAAADAVLTL